MRDERRLALLSAFVRGTICELDSECRYCDVSTTDDAPVMPAGDLIGRTIVDVLGEEIGQPLADCAARVYETGVPETLDYALALESGQRTFEARIVRVPDEAGAEPYRAVALIRDVTVERANEAKRREAELGVLAGALCHDINNPLMIVQENARTAAQALGTLSTSLEPDVFAASVAAVEEMVADVLAAASRIQNHLADLRMRRRDRD